MLKEVEKQLTITKLVLKFARGMNKQLLKPSGSDVLSIGKKKKTQKILMVGGGGASLYVGGLINSSRIKFAGNVLIHVE